MLNRQMIKAGMDAGVFGNYGNNEAAYRAILGLGAFGGKLNAKKKGGKDA